MKIKELKKVPNLEHNKRLSRAYAQFDQLLAELRTKSLPEDIIAYINNDLVQINAMDGTEKQLLKHVRATQASILKQLEFKLKLVTKNHYRNLWLALGMAAIGLPIGVAFGLSFGNMGYLAIGVPIGMGIGLVIGRRLDKKALEEGNQLDIEVTY